MDLKTSKLRDSLRAAGLKGRRARERKEEKRRKVSPAKWLEKEWASLMKSNHPGVEVKWTGAEYALAKKLVEEHGVERSHALIQHFIETWERRRVSRTGTPGLKLCWVMQSQLFAEMDGIIELPETRETRIRSGEYAGTGEDGANVGWGSRDDTPYQERGNGW